MLSGSLKYTIKLHRRTGNPNSITYTYYRTVKAAKLYKSGSSVVQAYQLLNTNTLTFRIRFRADIDESMRIEYNDMMYDILSIQQVGGYNGDLLVDVALTL